MINPSESNQGTAMAGTAKMRAREPDFVDGGVLRADWLADQ